MHSNDDSTAPATRLPSRRPHERRRWESKSAHEPTESCSPPSVTHRATHQVAFHQRGHAPPVRSGRPTRSPPPRSDEATHPLRLVQGQEANPSSLCLLQHSTHRQRDEEASANGPRRLREWLAQLPGGSCCRILL